MFTKECLVPDECIIKKETLPLVGSAKMKAMNKVLIEGIHLGADEAFKRKDPEVNVVALFVDPDDRITDRGGEHFNFWLDLSFVLEKNGKYFWASRCCISDAFEYYTDDSAEILRRLCDNPESVSAEEISKVFWSNFVRDFDSFEDFADWALWNEVKHEVNVDEYVEEFARLEREGLEQIGVYVKPE